MLRYALASHVFACLDGDHVVLLDLKQDRYFSFAAAQAHGLDTLVSGWPTVSIAREGGLESNCEPGRIARQLVERGLLTHQQATAQDTAQVAAPAATAELASDCYEESPPRRARSIVALLLAMAAATVVLRWGSLQRAVRRVRNRRERSRQDVSTFDIQRTRELVAIFTDLRPFIFTSRDRCLFESLVLIEFLARHGVFPSWIFGVQSRPFAAHCWVQQGETVLNDTIESIARYTPIMAV